MWIVLRAGSTGDSPRILLEGNLSGNNLPISTPLLKPENALDRGWYDRWGGG